MNVTAPRSALAKRWRGLILLALCLPFSLILGGQGDCLCDCAAARARPAAAAIDTDLPKVEGPTGTFTAKPKI